jgi:hypothetical protein
LIEVRRKLFLCAYGSYSRAKAAEAQFKQLQNDRAVFLQNFCFYPGARRDKIKKAAAAPPIPNTKHETPNTKHETPTPYEKPQSPDPGR